MLLQAILSDLRERMLLSDLGIARGNLGREGSFVCVLLIGQFTLDGRPDHHPAYARG